MCGRFVLTAQPEVIQQHFNLDAPPTTMQARYNIAPTQPVAVITNQEATALTYHRWGLIPSWAKDSSIGSRMINARAETLQEKPSFKHAFKRRRCLIPATGFYEWTGEGKAKRPMFIHLQDHTVFAFAGLWETWHSPEGEEIRTCTIITTEPNETIKPLHHRMAVILHPADYATWLQPNELESDTLMPLLRPYESDAMTVYEVSKLVNSPANDSPDCIVPVTPPPQQTALF